MADDDTRPRPEPKGDSEVCQEGRHVCECLAQMGNEYYFLPSGQCIFKEQAK